MNRHLRRFIFREIRSLLELIDNHDETCILHNAELDGFITALYFSGQINSRSYRRLSKIRFEHFSK